MADAAPDEKQYEDEHVHQVYNKIASHFSSTRFKPWPVVDSFLRTRLPGSVGLDVGCGNGKYLTVNKQVFMLASDRSSELIKFATAHQPHDACIADTLYLPHPDGLFDFAISIAVIHHLSSRERRREAIRCILKALKPGKPRPISDTEPLVEPGASSRDVDTASNNHKHEMVTKSTISRSDAGEALVFVWALEQKTSRRGWDTGDDQDVLVPWVLKPDMAKQSSKAKDDTHPTTSSTEPSQATEQVEPVTYQRYYHLYKQGELEEDIHAVGGKVVRNGYDRDNWWAVFTR